MEEEGDGARVGEGRSLRAFGKCSLVCLGEPGTDGDLAFGKLLSALLPLARFSVRFPASASSSLVLFKEDHRGGGISSTSISSSRCCFFFGCFFSDCCFCPFFGSSLSCFADFGHFCCCYCCCFASWQRFCRAG